VTRGLTDSSVCNSSIYGAEDLEIGKCMFNLGVLAADSRDGSKKGNFFPFPIQEHIVGTPLGWFKTASVFEPVPVTFIKWIKETLVSSADLYFQGLDCCSRSAISFHYIEPNQMYFYEYLLYQAQVAGVSKTTSALPRKFTVNEILKKNEFNLTDS
jgi:glycoprotein-N-acetylgalactosamine 3-beta-galactosyltransferase